MASPMLFMSGLVEIEMITIRDYDEKTDAQSVSILIAETYRKYNLDFAPPEEQQKLLGPFRHVYSSEKSHRDEIARVLRAEMVFVAENDGEIVGILRGRKERIQSLFVHGDRLRQGIGRRLVEHFEQACARLDSRVIRVAATQYAVPFYRAMGYRKSSGIRNAWSFEGTGLKYQPMKKILK
jgi:GNAT superfamily N-acetyltransferase